MLSATLISIDNLACGFVYIGLRLRCRISSLDFRTSVGAAAIWQALVPVFASRTGLDFPRLFHDFRTTSGSLQCVGSRGANT
jgi:hypothetical protein